MVQKGEIWPNTTAQFSIIFKPEEAKLYHHTVYCDVTGQCGVRSDIHTFTVKKLKLINIYNENMYLILGKSYLWSFDPVCCLWTSVHFLANFLANLVLHSEKNCFQPLAHIGLFQHPAFPAANQCLWFSHKRSSFTLRVTGPRSSQATNCVWLLKDSSSCSLPLLLHNSI